MVRTGVGTTAADDARLAAWLALSDLFLDTDLDDLDIASIARRLRATGIGGDELERIYENEVAPACWRNQHALPGGQWSGFEPAWLRESIERARAEAPGALAIPWVRRLRVKRWTALSRADWNRVKRLLDVRTHPIDHPDQTEASR